MQRDTKIKPTTRVTFSDAVTRVAVSLPGEWDDLTNDQIRYVCRLKALGCRGVELATYAAIRWCGLDVSHQSKVGWQCTYEGRMFPLEDWQIIDMARRLLWLNNVDHPVRPDVLRRGTKGVDAFLHGLEFGQYLQLENYWAGYLATGEPQYLREVAAILYQRRAEEMLPLDGIEQCIVVQWMTGWKSFCRRHWSYLFRVSEGDERPTAGDMEASMLAQIRALTGGDVTKEDVVLKLDVWSALNELNAKVREAEAQRKELNNIRHGNI
jgi:hypothetical protein